jgi:ribose 5-phosphate isomerase B
MPSTVSVIAVASDHAGFELKEAMKAHLAEEGIKVVDLGAYDQARVDYPDFGARLAEAVRAGQAPLGLAICGTGIGISIALNRHKGIRAALCHDVTSARLARGHNDANVLCLGARTTGAATAADIIDAFLEGAFEGGRHAARVEKLETLG